MDSENYLDDDFDSSFDADLESALIRPYVRSNGRAEAAHELQFETVLSVTDLYESLPDPDRLSEDQRLICDQCASPQSVAEIAVAIDAPLGVARVLISDAIDQGLLMVHETTPIIEGRPPMDILKRVHAGIAKLA